MLFDLLKKNQFSNVRERRKKLIEAVRSVYPSIKQAKILLIGGFERHGERFLQESNFYYLTGLTEPGLVMSVDLDGRSVVYMPAYSYDRAKWSVSSFDTRPEKIGESQVDEVKFLGNPGIASEFHLLCTQEDCCFLLHDLAMALDMGDNAIFSLNPINTTALLEQRLFLERLEHFSPRLKKALINIAPFVFEGRRTKDMREIELIHKAVQIAMAAQEAAAEVIEPGEQEGVVQAALEWVMTASKSKPSFPSIVAGGKNATVLHYINNEDFMKSGDLVIVDIGARIDGYCSDITRTYPVSGYFNKRQKEIYNIVLEVQAHLEEIAAPGFWISNKDFPEQSLNHVAKKIFAHYGLERFFGHNIGHFLGLDVHDVGDVMQPLRDGDVITIEPGLYLPDEGLGIRIEDDYWVAAGGVVCLSDGLVKDVVGVEALMKNAKK